MRSRSRISHATRRLLQGGFINIGARRSLLSNKDTKPVLSLDFMSGLLDPRVTFTRASSGTYIGSDGLLKTKGLNLLTNSVLAGGVSGIASAGAVAPTGGWTLSGGGDILFSGGGVALTCTANRVRLIYPATRALNEVLTVSCTLLSNPSNQAINNFLALSNSTGTIGALTFKSDGTTVTSTFIPVAGARLECSGTVTAAGLISSIFGLGVALSVNTCSGSIADFQSEFGTVANKYSPTTTTSTSGPRFDYDPAVPAGTTGGELNPDNTFATGWTLGGWTVSGGQATSVTGGASALFAQPSLLVTGKTYTVSFDVITPVAGVSTVFLRSINIGNPVTTTAGRKTLTGVAGTSGSRGVEFYGQPGLVIANVSFQEVTFAPRGLMVEEQRTNLLLHSRDMTQTAWGKADTTITRNQVGIDGQANSACLFTEGVLNNAQTYQDTAVTANQTITQSFVIKRGNTDWVRCYMYDVASATDVLRGWFNLATGATGSKSQSGTASGVTTTITPLGGGCYRCTLTGLVNATGTNIRFALLSAAADNSTTRVNNAIYIVDAAQLEVGGYASSIIFTGAATVTRAADTQVMTGTNFSDWWNEPEGTFVAEFDSSSTSSLDQFVLCTSAGGASSNRHQIIRRTSSATGSATVSAGAVSADISTGTVVNNVPLKVAFAYALNNFAAASGGVLGTPDTSGALPAVAQTQMVIGSRWAADTLQLNGHIRSLQYYNKRLSNAQLQRLTA